MMNLGIELVDSLGLNELSPKEKEHFLFNFRLELECRVGKELVSGLDDATIDEFDHFIEQNMPFVDEWLDEHYSLDDEENREGLLRSYTKLSNSTSGPVDFDSFKCDYGAILWLELNCPNYQQITLTVFNSFCTYTQNKVSEILEYYQALSEQGPLNTLSEDDLFCLRSTVQRCAALRRQQNIGG